MILSILWNIHSSQWHWEFLVQLFVHWIEIEDIIIYDKNKNGNKIVIITIIIKENQSQTEVTVVQADFIQELFQ